MIARVLTLLLVLACITFVATAKEAQSISDDPAIDKRVTELSRQLRCLVCQSESLADSQADWAADVRREMREQMKAGKSDEEVVAFLRQRFSDYILFNPRVKPTTYLLWFGPFILLGGGLVILFYSLKRRRALIQDRPLTDAERQRASEMLQTESAKESA